MKIDVTPIGWQVCNLGDVLKVEMGQSPPGSSYSENPNDIPFLQGKTEFKEYYPEIRKYTSKPTKIVEKDTILLSVRAPVGPTNIAPMKLCIGRGLAGIYSDIIPHKYILYYFRNIESNLSKQGTGTTFASINKSLIEKLQFPVPPINEQHRISDKLDLVFQSFDSLGKKIENIPVLIDKFKQSVLKQAMAGALIKFSRSENLKLRDVLTLEYGKSLPNNNRSGEGYPVYGSNGIVGYHKDFLVKGPGIVVGRKGSNGEVTWSNNNFFPIDTSYYVKLKRKDDLKFIYYLLQTLDLKKYNRSTAIPGLNREDAYNIEVSIPSEEIQKLVVKKINELFELANSIEAKYLLLKDIIEKLPNQILTKAFSGELVAQNPNDESVSKLLIKLKESKKKN